jgi:hypothetical protein
MDVSYCCSDLILPKSLQAEELSACYGFNGRLIALLTMVGSPCWSKRVQTVSCPSSMRMRPKNHLFGLTLLPVDDVRLDHASLDNTSECASFHVGSPMPSTVLCQETVIKSWFDGAVSSWWHAIQNMVLFIIHMVDPAKAFLSTLVDCGQSLLLLEELIPGSMVYSVLLLTPLVDVLHDGKTSYSCAPTPVLVHRSSQGDNETVLHWAMSLFLLLAHCLHCSTTSFCAMIWMLQSRDQVVIVLSVTTTRSPLDMTMIPY